MSTNKKNELAKALSFKGGVYIEEKNYEEALEYFNESLSIFESINDFSGIADSYNNIGLSLSKKGDHEDAFDHYIKALNIVKTKTFNQLQLADIESNIAYSYYETGDSKTAISHWMNVLKSYIKCNTSLEKKYKVLSNVLLTSKYEDWEDLKQFFYSIFPNKPMSRSNKIIISSNCKKDSVVSNRQYYSCKVFINNEVKVLDDILIVIYRLHPTFPIQYQQPVVYSTEQNNFPLSIKCWGCFDIDIFIIFKNDSCSEYSHYLNIF